jgi:hypothetical protein
LPSGKGKEARIVKLKMPFFVVESRIETRELNLGARASFFEPLASIRVSSPITN